MEKQIAINILEDIKVTLLGNNAKENGLKIVEIYRKNLEIATNKKIIDLIEKYTIYVKEYGEEHSKSIKLAKKIDEEMKKIYNKKI